MPARGHDFLRMRAAGSDRGNLPKMGEFQFFAKEAGFFSTT